MVDILEDVESTQKLIEAGEFTLSSLASSHGITEDDVETLLAFAKLQYECGKYDLALPYLRAYRSLKAPLSSAVATSILFGILGCSTIPLNCCIPKFRHPLVRPVFRRRWPYCPQRGHRGPEIWFTCLKTTSTSVPYHVNCLLLLSSSWFLHYATLVFFNVPNGPSLLLEFVFDGSDRYPGTSCLSFLTQKLHESPPT